MLLWFAGTAIVAVGFVFRDPRFDYRLLIAGSVLPLADALLGRARPLHSITASVVLLVLIMAGTTGRRPLRRSLLGLPIGMFLHLVFDGAWTDTSTFWWPFTGWSFGGERLPELARGWTSVVLEVVGLVLCGWLWVRNELSDPHRRREFLRHGRLDAVAGRDR